ncbi:hypothetical protein LZQ00_10885 [Sphingobacterium sp. SRCM116780]|uniref:hypothetical protein n=1 Tax=Sphingobacterium sp. SRCM116780 TaxID=2907623 RepID=UPI001F32676D|nr:hypothetical protein [Sphingobacterium sp. SRCM116780]UIR54781.1 hypothetical protein LZQ00_10885 [Sphingobacterium sp. SRCM116780]
MKYSTLFILLLFTVLNIKAQTYIQGESVTPLSGIATSQLLPASKRLSMEDAFGIYKTRNSVTSYKQSLDLVGEFWLIDNMLIKIVSRTILLGKKEDFQKLRYAYRPEGAGVGKAFKGIYFDEVKNVNNYETLVYYFRTDNNKYFEIQDKQNRYKLMGTIISTKEDSAKAEAFINTLLNSITFK